MIYLDNAATSYPKAPGTADAVCQYLNDIGANTGRSSYSSARKASRIIVNTKESLAELFGISESTGIVFTSGATESLNTVLFGLPNIKTVLTSKMEHNSVIRPLRFLETNNGIEIIQFKSGPYGFPDMNDYRKKLEHNPDLIITTGASNVTGVIFPFTEMAELAAKKNIIFVLDASQISGLYPLKLLDTDIDIIAFSGHKGLMGPPGIGVLAFGERIFNLITDRKLYFRPLKFGGTGSRSYSEQQPDFFPDFLESGTPNIVGIAGLGAAVDFILKEGLDNIRQKKDEKFSQLYQGIESLNAVKKYSPYQKERQIGILSLTVRNISLSDLAYEMDKRDICVRMGLHCSPAAHRTIGTFEGGGTLRFSPGYFTNQEDIENAVASLNEIIEKYY